MRKASQKSWFNGLLSLLFALLLFFNANATGNNPSNSGSSQTYSETLNNIPVQVQYDKDKYYVSGFEESVNVQALDAKGQVLSIENPAPQVKVTVGLTAPTKDVPLNVSMTGTPPAGIAHYNYSLSTYQVRVSGPQSILDTLESIEVPVDISDIRKETKQSVTIPVNGEYVVTPDEVDVSLSPVYNQQQSSNTNETSEEPASSTTVGSGSQAVQPSTSSQVESNTSETTSEGSTVESTTAGSTENTENQVTKENQNG